MGDVTKTPINIGDSWVIVAVNSRTEANMTEFAQERDRLMDEMLNRKRGEVFQDYLASTKQKLETAGSIKIYAEAIAKLDAPTGLPGGLPDGMLPIGEP